MFFGRDSEQMHEEDLKKNNDDYLKSLSRCSQHNKLIQMADEKRFYRQLKRNVECEMKSNDNLCKDEIHPMYVPIKLFS